MVKSWILKFPYLWHQLSKQHWKMMQFIIYLRQIMFYTQCKCKPDILQLFVQHLLNGPPLPQITDKIWGVFCESIIWSMFCLSQQDRRWNADKPSAALDPYIPTWLTTSPANHRPANFWFFFLTLKWNCEKWWNLRSNWWASILNLKFPFSDSFKYK